MARKTLTELKIKSLKPKAARYFEAGETRRSALAGAGHDRDRGSALTTSTGAGPAWGRNGRRPEFSTTFS
jgi:hypothetical protein